jgi:membrane protein YdbS with pleckstrin-like domain
MAGEEYPTPGEPDPRRGQDRDTEPIPRARPEAGDDTAQAPRYVGSVSAGGLYSPAAPTPSFTEAEFGGLRVDGAPSVVTSNRIQPLDGEEGASPFILRYLFPTEKFRGEWRRHWIQIFKELATAVVVTILMGYLTGLAARYNYPTLVTVVILVWGVVMVALAWRIADWYMDRFILTNKRVMVVKGLVTRNVGMMPLQRVTDMKYVQSPLGRMLGYGTFELESAGQDQALSKVKNLPNPNELYLRIVEEMYEPEAVEARLSRGADTMGDDDGT